MSGVAISEKIGISRVTMAKYLKVFAAKGLLRQKNIGNIILWFLEPGQELFVFPDDYFKAASLYLDHLVKGSEDNVFALIRNCLRSGAVASRLIFEVVIPAIALVDDLYDTGKIGTAERRLLQNTISMSLQIFNQMPVISEPKKNMIMIAADAQSSMVSEAASAAYRSEGWKVSHLGDMSPAISVLFDLDFQKLIGKIWRQKLGIMIVVILSQTHEGMSFFAESIGPVKKKSRGRMKLALCGKMSQRLKIDCDISSERIEEMLQWSETVYQNLK